MKQMKMMVSALVLLVAVLAAGCGDDTQTTALKSGMIKSSLLGVSTEGQVYRLRGARFDITGPESMLLNSEDYLDTSEIYTDLAVGGYTIELLPGWYLERQAGSGFEPVEAILTSSAVVQFDIFESQVTGVLFMFRAGDDVVPIGEGALSVQIAIDDTPSNTVPGEWTCTPTYYGSADGCDCGCGVIDPDCVSADISACAYNNCAPGTEVDPGDITSCIPSIVEICDNGIDDDGNGLVDCVDDGCRLDPACAPEVPAEWTCSPFFYGLDQCDCGCGAMDLDCTSTDISACVYNNCASGTEVDPADITSCIPSIVEICDNGIDDDGNGAVDCGDIGCRLDAACLPEVPAEWTCTPLWYGTVDGCDCGCGAIDLDCASTDISACEFQNCPEGTQVDPANIANCI